VAGSSNDGWDSSQVNPSPTGQANYNNDGSGSWNDYQGPSLPQSNFPQLDASGATGSVSYSPDKLTQVARAMQDELNALNAANGAPAKLKANGALQAGYVCGPHVQFGWPTAAAFGMNTNNATTGVTQFYNDLSNAYNTVIGNIHTTVSNYSNADQATQQAANNATA
jgi:hypothetical protein